MSFGLLNKKLAGVAFAAMLGAFAVSANAPQTVAASAHNFSTSTQTGNSGSATTSTEATKVAGKKKRKKRRKKRRRRGSYYSG